MTQDRAGRVQQTVALSLAQMKNMPQAAPQPSYHLSIYLKPYSPKKTGKLRSSGQKEIILAFCALYTPPHTHAHTYVRFKQMKQ